MPAATAAMLLLLSHDDAAAAAVDVPVAEVTTEVTVWVALEPGLLQLAPPISQQYVPSVLICRSKCVAFPALIWSA